jgi:hypothetical protein
MVDDGGSTLRAALTMAFSQLRIFTDARPWA